MTDFNELNALESPLAGFNLIEASAGTGKTWNICGLYLRLLVERELRVNQILVVTFTKAATAELRDRIRRRIVEMLEALSGTGASGDAFIDQLLARWKSQGYEEVSLRACLKLARESFDEAAIFTIHGFCQRALGDAPFSAGQPFNLEAVEDDRERLQQVVNDFWRRSIAHPGGDSQSTQESDESRSARAGLPPAEPMSTLLAGYLIQCKDSPEKFAELLETVLGQSLADLRWPADLDTFPEPDSGELQLAFKAAHLIWQADGPSILKTLLDGVEAGCLKKTSYKPDSIEQGYREWSAWFGSQADGLSFPGTDDKLNLYRSSQLAEGKGTRQGQTPPAHVFFDAAEKLLAASELLQRALALARLRLLRRLVAELPERLRQSRRQQRVVSFDDMLANLHRALTESNDNELARALRIRFPAALIDEFQDTDPLQFGIFETIYNPKEAEKGTLFLVGDPKQAIYRFRNADLHTYLRAQERVDRRYSLPNNQRSVPGLIGACNVLFGANPSAFLQAGIEYRPVGVGEKQKSLVAFTDQGGASRADLHIWTLRGDNEGVPTRAEAKQLAAEATAVEIVRLLNEADGGQVRIGDRPLAAGDLAVLVRSHREGRLMRRTLEARGVACVELSMASVWSTLEAEELERILLALAEKRDNLLRAALATDLLGGTADTLEALSRDEVQFFARVEQFARYRDIWSEKGFAVMFRQLLREEGVETRLLGQPSGERRLTNVLHLGELLAEAAREQIGIDALLRWLHSRRAVSAGGENAQLRLESDSQRVKIVTIHKSKGLEYPVVFCPFLWDGYRNARPRQADLRQYHEPEIGKNVIDFDEERFKGEPVKALLRDEEAAETLRLIYVALTRSVYRTYLIAGCYGRPGKNGVNCGESARAMLNWLMLGEGVAPGDWFDSKKSAQRTPEVIQAAWQALGGKESAVTPSLKVEPLPLPDLLPVLAQRESTAGCVARPFSRRLEETWNRGSFSWMTRNRPSREEGADHDEDVVNEKVSAAPPLGMAESDILRFPRGALAGNCLHRLFEYVDFGSASPADQAIERALADYPQTGGPELKVQLQNLLDDVLKTPLPAMGDESIRLEQVVRADQLRELNFTLGAGRLTAPDLNRFIREARLEIPRLRFHELKGYLTGAIDLVFRQGGRYYLLDWKSNHLGYTPEAYSLPGLRDEMRDHVYGLQSLVYTLALHRFLTARLPDYDYERDFGGTYYLFVRGVRPGWVDGDGFPTGVLYERTPYPLVQAFDQLINEDGRHE